MAKCMRHIYAFLLFRSGLECEVVFYIFSGGHMNDHLNQNIMQITDCWKQAQNCFTVHLLLLLLHIWIGATEHNVRQKINRVWNPSACEQFWMRKKSKRNNGCERFERAGMADAGQYGILIKFYKFLSEYFPVQRIYIKHVVLAQQTICMQVKIARRRRRGKNKNYRH